MNIVRLYQEWIWVKRMQKILLWGTGKIADEVLSQCGTLKTYDILGIIDNNSEKIGDSFHEYKIVGPDSILLKNPSTRLSHEACLGVKTNSNRPGTDEIYSCTFPDL